MLVTLSESDDGLGAHWCAGRWKREAVREVGISFDDERLWMNCLKMLFAGRQMCKAE